MQIKRAFNPVAVSRIIVLQLMRAEPLGEWHIPARSILVTVAWIVAAWMAGSATIRRLMPAAKQLCCSTRAVLSFSTGFVLFAWLQLLLGLAGQLWIEPLPLFLFFGLLLFATNPADRAAMTEFPRAVFWQWKSAGAWAQVTGLLFLFCVCCMLPPALTPPVQSDAVRYHLGAPQEYLKNGIIGYLPLNAYSNMPFLMEMHYLVALQLRAPESTQLMHLVIAVVASLGVYAISRQLSPPGATGCHAGTVVNAPQLLPLLLYFCIPMSAVLASWPFTDHAISLLLTASVLGAVVCLMVGWNCRVWAGFGLLLGGLIGTKYTMAPIAVWLFAGTTFLLIRGRRRIGSEPQISGDSARQVKRVFHTPWMAWLTASSLATLVGGSWFLKNWFLVGNPVYPFANSIFQGGEWRPANDAFLQARAGLKGFGQDLPSLLSVPLHATFSWTRFEAHNPGVSIWVGLISVAAGAVMLFWKSAGRNLSGPHKQTDLSVSEPGISAAVACKSALFLLLTTTLAGFVVWFFTYQSNRLLLPVLALALSAAPWFLFSRNRWVSRTVTAASLTAAVLGIAWAVQWSWVATGLSPQPLPYLLGKQNANTYREKSLTYAAAFDYLNHNVRSSERVLLVGEHRIYGARFHAVWSDWFDTPALVWLLRTQNISSLDQLLSYLRQQNITWVLINERELEPQLERDFRPWFRPAEWKIFEELRRLKRPDVTIKHMSPGVTLLHLQPESAP